jgi:phosphate transport system permease protein
MQTTLNSKPAVLEPPFEMALRKRRRPHETIIQALLFACGIISIFTTLGIVFVLLAESMRFFGSGQVNLIEFLTGTTWQPAIGEFGILPLFVATIMTSLIGMVVALPLVGRRLP